MKVTTTPDDNPNAVVKKPCCKSKNISLVRAAFLFYQLQRLGHWNLVSFPLLTRGELERWKSNQPIEMKHAAGEKRGKRHSEQSRRHWFFFYFLLGERMCHQFVFKGTVTRLRARVASWSLVWGTVFRSRKKISFHRPISVREHRWNNVKGVLDHLWAILAVYLCIFF